MLKIWYGNDSLDKENFIFGNIDHEQKTLLIVPDQYSLQMERNVLEYFSETKGISALLNLQVLDFSSLGYKVVEETEGPKPDMIDKYGRHMLLSAIIEKRAEDLSVFRGMAGKGSFSDMMNNLISEMKRYDVTCDTLRELIDSMDKEQAGSYLDCKLRDILDIYREYEEAIEGRFLDSEDYIDFYGERILSSQLVKDAVIWIYGFDTFTPKNMLIIQRLMKRAAEVNVVMTHEAGEAAGGEWPGDARFLTTNGGTGLFKITGYVMNQLAEAAAEINEDTRCEEIRCDRRKSIWSEGLPEADAVSLVETSDVYAEAERCAAEIVRLVRDEGYRYGEIAVICNDMTVRGNILNRTFERWGIPTFYNARRNIMHQPVISFLLNFLDVIIKGYTPAAVMALARTGLLGWSVQEVEMLSNYAVQFKIRGAAWKKPFTKKGDVYTDEQLERLNEMRAFIVDAVERAKDDIGRRNTAAEKFTGLYGFLERDFSLKERIQNLIDHQQNLGLASGAMETAQSWNVICEILEQGENILGDAKISNETFEWIIRMGLMGMTIGLVPVTEDCVIVGTVQRTRLSGTRALLVTGANEGILPVQGTEEGILSQRELETLEELNVRLAKKEDVKRQEEQLAIYRMMTLPVERLYMSCSRANENGESLIRSAIFNSLVKLPAQTGSAEELPVAGDLTEGEVLDMVTTEKGTLSFMAKAMRDYVEGSEISDEWYSVMDWYRNNSAVEFDRITTGLTFDNKVEALGNELADRLYRGDREDISVSATRLESYSGCPFAHFMKYGLRAEEQKVFEVGSREIGDAYHDCLMKFTQSTKDWDTLEEEECRARVADILAGMEGDDGYGEGVFAADKESSFRLARICEICGDAAWALVKQIRSGQIKRILCEEDFGRGSNIPAREIKVGDKTYYVRGRIDRLDILNATDENGESFDAARVVDYKTGNPSVNIDHIRAGYKLQLMLYMDAVSRIAQPAGVFYFKIKEVDTDATGRSVTDGKILSRGNDTLADRMQGEYRLEGITVNDESLIKSMDKDLEKKSTVLPIKTDKQGVRQTYSGSALLSDDEFAQLLDEVNSQVDRICREIDAGEIKVAPKKEKKESNKKERSACTYCDYRSVCMFDTTFPDCEYIMV